MREGQRWGLFDANWAHAEASEALGKASVRAMAAVEAVVEAAEKNRTAPDFPAIAGWAASNKGIDELPKKG